MDVSKKQLFKSHSRASLSTVKLYPLYESLHHHRDSEPGVMEKQILDILPLYLFRFPRLIHV